jgi:hypothetical protein
LMRMIRTSTRSKTSRRRRPSATASTLKVSPSRKTLHLSCSRCSHWELLIRMRREEGPYLCTKWNKRSQFLTTLSRKTPSLIRALTSRRPRGTRERNISSRSGTQRSVWRRSRDGARTCLYLTEWSYTRRSILSFTTWIRFLESLIHGGLNLIFLSFLGRQTLAT